MSRTLGFVGLMKGQHQLPPGLTLHDGPARVEELRKVEGRSGRRQEMRLRKKSKGLQGSYRIDRGEKGY